MSSTAHILGPVTGATAFIPPEEREAYNQFVASYMDDLTPESTIEDTLADEIIQAAWRLHRCATIERQPITEETDNAELDRLQASIDRARATAQRSYHRALAELRRVQSERVYRAAAVPKTIDTDNFGQADCRKLNLVRPAQNKANRESPLGVPAEDKANTREEMDRRYNETIARVEAEIAKQTQSIGKQFPRNSPCPCASGQKYKRCCGTGAPPVLNTVGYAA